MVVKALDNALKSPALKQVLRHWSEVRGAGRMPGWSDIRPSRIAQQLSMVWSYTYDPASDSFTGRLAGDRIELLFGKSFRNTPLSQLFPAAEYQDAFQRLKHVISEPAGFRCEGLVFRQLEKFGYGERMILPLAADGVNPDGVLGATDYRSFIESDDERIRQSDEWYPL